MTIEIIYNIIVFIFGIVIGSFLNVCIFRIPRKENIAISRSHCMNCGYNLKWYDMFPIFSYLFLRGKCRKCGQKISIQYPIIEALNGILYVTVVVINGFNYESLIYCILVSALLVLSIIDFRTIEIPDGINIFILIVGIIHMIMNINDWQNYVIGFFAVSLFLLLLFKATNGRGIGGGDVKLMATCGLVIGWKLILLAFFLGCIIGSICHLVRMKISKVDNKLALGPYLSIGVFIAILFGNQLIDWYLKLCM